MSGRRRLALEALEGREVPAHLTWLGGTGASFSNAASWRMDTTGEPTRAPQAGDDLAYDGQVSSADCPDFSGVVPVPLGWTGDGDLNSVYLVNGYSGKVSYVTPVPVHVYKMTCGTFTPTGQANDLTVLDRFAWSGGTINDSALSATVHIQGATATITPPLGDDLPPGTIGPVPQTLSLATGSTLSFETGATGMVLPGAINFTNSAGVYVGNAILQVNPAGANQARRPLVVFDGVNAVGVPQITVDSGGTMSVLGGDFNSNFIPLRVTGGLFEVRNPTTTATFAGKVVNGVGSVEMTAGTIRLEHGTKLTASAGMYLSGGKLTTVESAGPAALPLLPAEIIGNVFNSGADVVICDGSAVRTRFGLLQVNGDVNWTGGTYRPVVLITDTTKADMWRCSGTFTIDAGSAAVAPGAVNAQGNQQKPAAGMIWQVIQGVTRLNARVLPQAQADTDWRVNLNPDGRTLEVVSK